MVPMYIFQSFHTRIWRCYLLVTIFALSTLAEPIFFGDIFGDDDDDNSGNITANVRLYTQSECNRECTNNEPSRVCYYQLHIEYYTTMGGACQTCSPTIQNQLTGTPSCECVWADGVEKTILAINRMLPGPFIRVCQNDGVIIDLVNEAEGLDVTIHWHGIFQNGYQYYDGVPYVTQCPIHASNTFRYQFRVKNAGTHFYHSHVGVQMMDGIYGALIVAQPPKLNPHYGLYDRDEHIMLISDLFHRVAMEQYPGRYHFLRGQAAENVLINGQGNWTDPRTGASTNVPYYVFDVQQGLKYRFRIINSFSTVCLAQIQFENHACNLISVDGEDVEPTIVNELNTASGNRYDCIITADRPVGSYWIRVKALGECAEIELQQFAILRYRGAPATPATPKPAYSVGLLNPITLFPLNTDTCGFQTPANNQICINQLRKKIPVRSEIMEVLPNYRLILPFDFYNYNDTGLENDLFAPGSFKRFFVAIDRSHLQSLVANISYQDGPAPPLTQSEGYERMCTEQKLSTCTQPCTCTHAYNMPLRAVIEVILVDTGDVPFLWHPFHLHGYSFTVFEMGQFNGTPTVNDINQVIDRHTQKLSTGFYVDPPNVDTIIVPSGGYVVMRFYTDNPGWWFFHCHFTWHTASGMNVVFHVGNQGDLPPIPPKFPECYNYLPPMDLSY